ncbi:MAG: hypothetical protein Q8R18_02790 [bacterium]|nr:hypothetical protein [bacterium]
MALGNLLSGGVLTFVIILLVVFVLWILYKIVFAPILSLFGFGTRSMGKLAGRGLGNLMDDWTKGRNGEERARKESAEEGEEESLVRKGYSADSDAMSLLRNISSTQNFNSENVKIMTNSVKLQEQCISERRKILNDLKSSYKEDRKYVGKLIDDLKAGIRGQGKIEKRALEIAREIEKYHVTVENNTYGRIVEIAERIKPLEERVQPFEQKNIELSRALEESVTQRENLLKAQSTALDKMKSSLKKDPILPELQNIEEQQMIINTKLQTEVTITQEARSIQKEHAQIAHGVNQILSQVIPLLQEQDRAIQASTAQLVDLVNRGAIPKKLAA